VKSVLPFVILLLSDHSRSVVACYAALYTALSERSAEHAGMQTNFERNVGKVIVSESFRFEWHSLEWSCYDAC
jgi:hypothetical protein